MALLDVPISGVVGLILVARPQSLYWGPRATCNPKKLRLLRGLGVLFLVVEILYQSVRLAIA